MNAGWSGTHFEDFTPKKFYALLKVPQEIIGVSVALGKIQLTKIRDFHRKMFSSNLENMLRALHSYTFI